MEHGNHTSKELLGKLREIYPEIEEHGIGMSAEFSHEKNAWIIGFKKDDHELTTHLERKDADSCLEGVQCVYFGVQIAQFFKNFEAAE